MCNFVVIKRIKSVVHIAVLEVYDFATACVICRHCSAQCPSVAYEVAHANKSARRAIAELKQHMVAWPKKKLFCFWPSA